MIPLGQLRISLGLIYTEFIFDALQDEVNLLEIRRRILLEHLQVALILVGLQNPMHNKLVALISKLNFIIFFNSA